MASMSNDPLDQLEHVCPHCPGLRFETVWDLIDHTAEKHDAPRKL